MGNANPGPIQEVVPLAEQLANHDEYRPQATDDLVGEEFSLYINGDTVLEVRFESASELSWRSDRGLQWGFSGHETYEAFLLRSGIYGVVVARLDEHLSAFAILDTNTSRALINATRFVEGTAGRKEDTRVYQAGVGGPIEHPFPLTTELVGKRVHHRYSSTHVYEHIYLNSATYAWHCLEGPEAGMADVDRTDTHKIAEGMYLFSWHERSQPWNGAVVTDLLEGCSKGRACSWDPATGETFQILTGAISTLLNETSYEGL